MWKKGWKVTCAWMAGYAFLCIYPRLVLLLPHLALLGILLTTYQLQHPEATLPTAFSETAPPCSLPQSSEGSADWYANLQAIQNLMGAVADAHDATQPLVLHMTWSTRATLPLFLFLLSTLFPLAALLRFIPLRPVFLVGGLLPFLITHPYTLALLPSLQHQLAPSLTTALTKAGDDARLEERHWAAAADKDAQGNPRMLRDFEVWENERWTPTTGWKSANLRTGERKAWTRDGEGRNDIITGAEDVRGRRNSLTSLFSHSSKIPTSHITFKLDPGWAFVETEDWHADLLGAWSKVGADEDGWVYTNDAWQDPHDVAVDDWKSNGMTRRRRWTRRVYFMGIAEAKK
ncbi:hypothetical protein BOTBODRAFT_124738 [Botryobasidium botryosum FD-172 SS1]|uniref:TECPR1-like DysF domain-containing protein n=1 Tax=Botryobasidium botryosum (strain FD-172 SS1) TaxID=930990 RepID=A0A067NAV1_BOTB1|nr:hypothetical protein BOTBODRAFT_124738 [Botryobasidium botryosum FD-172 SS1]